jgi:gas vesicle protein
MELEDSLSMSAQNDTATRFLWFFAGATLGASLALLYAPASGRATRRFIRSKAEKGKEALTDSGRELIGKSRELYEKGRQMADEAAEMFERGRKLVDS